VEAVSTSPSPAAVREHDRRSPAAYSVVIVTLLVIGALRLAQTVVLPIVIAVLLTLMLGAPVRWLHRLHVPERLAAALVVFGALGAALGSAALLASPAQQWVASAPETINKLEAKVRRLSLPLTALQHSADRMARATGPSPADAPKTVQIASPSLLARASLDMLAAVPVALAVVFLTYFLLASGPLFRRKLAGLLPGRDELRRREHLLAQIELAASHFLVTVVAVNTCVGVLTALTLWAVGVPNPLVWGGVAAILNFVPYLGPIVTAALITLAALAGLDQPARALIAPAVFVVIHMTETNLVTPTLLGRHLPVNTVAIFVGLLFFGWLWGIPGAVLAVPLTVCAKLVCDHVPALAHVGELLDN
jgi:predicted PurR-regulated permease PerM